MSFAHIVGLFYGYSISLLTQINFESAIGLVHCHIASLLLSKVGLFCCYSRSLLLSYGVSFVVILYLFFAIGVGHFCYYSRSILLL